MSGDKAQLTLLVGDVIYNQETHTNKGEAHEWMPLFVYAHMRVYQRERAFRGSFLFFRSSFSVLISRVALKRLFLLTKT